MPDAAALRRRILVLLPFPPRLDAAHGGGRATANLLLRLAERHDVAVLYLRAEDEPEIDSALEKLCRLTQEVRRPNEPQSVAQGWRLRLRLALALLRGTPTWCERWNIAAFRNEVQQLARSWQPDIVQFEYHLLGQYRDALAGAAVPTVLVQHEPGTPRARELQRSHSGFAALLPLLDRLAWARYEAALYRQMDSIVVFTERDRRAVQELAPHAPLVQIPLSVACPPHPLNPLGSEPTVLFVGNFTHPPNVDAALHLLRDIFPKVREHYPRARALIVGAMPPPPLRQIAGDGVEITGLVPDVVPYLDRAAVVVAPLRTGGGMRVKVVEALAAGKALVATSLAVEGLNVANGREVLIADDPEEFSRAIVHLLVKPEARASLAADGRAWACATLDGQRSAREYEVLYEKLISAAT